MQLSTEFQPGTLFKTADSTAILNTCFHSIYMNEKFRLLSLLMRFRFTLFF
jgi:hypothetical protein